MGCPTVFQKPGSVMDIRNVQMAVMKPNHYAVSLSSCVPYTNLKNFNSTEFESNE